MPLLMYEATTKVNNLEFGEPNKKKSQNENKSVTSTNGHAAETPQKSN